MREMEVDGEFVFGGEEGDEFFEGQPTGPEGGGGRAGDATPPEMPVDMDLFQFRGDERYGLPLPVPSSWCVC